ncbi:hypothetical protein AM1_1039 [Acaryochloris marina MBIC11017]|uniref:Uncharacterized protein n=1 Tax=Acaryochloris marina (strain MBIC 11017) TaxID=329726 RepID=B0C1R3_ACAM1|nr:hypothetical protein AM1_1039 [Acaryochloris marina MBIC11017]
MIVNRAKCWLYAGLSEGREVLIPLESDDFSQRLRLDWISSKWIVS